MIRKIVSLLIVLLAAFLCWWLMDTAPVQTTEEKPRSAKIVKTISPPVKNHPISVSAYGSVIPARSLTIRPEITGRIISQHPALVPGGRIVRQHERRHEQARRERGERVRRHRAFARVVVSVVTQKTRPINF